MSISTSGLLLYDLASLSTGSSSALTVSGGQLYLSGVLVSGGGGGGGTQTFYIGQVLSSAPNDGGTWLQMTGQVVAQATYTGLFGLVGHKPIFNISTTNLGSINPTVIALSQVAYATGMYVVVGGSTSNIFTSPDLTNWTDAGVTLAVSPVQSPSVAYGNGLFVAVGGTGVYSSPDAIAWTMRSGSSVGVLNNVVFENGRFVAIGNGCIHSSLDGTNWFSSQPNGTNLFTVSYAPTIGTGLWMAIGGGTNFNSAIAYSTDGGNWSSVAKPTTNNAAYLGFDRNYFYVGDIFSGSLYRTSNGASWTNFGTIPFPATRLSSTISFSISGGAIGLAPFLYTTNGYTGISTPNVLPGPIGTISIINPQGQPQNFILGVGTVGGLATVDGKTWTTVNDPRITLPSTPSTSLRNYANGYSFMFSAVGGAPSLYYIKDPYNPSTQFQIPMNSGYYIKAL